MQRIKDLIKIKEIIDEHNKKIEESISQTSKLKDELGKVNEGISDLKKSMNDLKFRHKDLENNFKESSGMINGIKEEFDEELSDLKVLKSKLQTSIIEKLSEDFRAELLSHVERIKTDSSSYNQLKDEVSEIALKTNKLGKEIEKFIAISQNIKKSDFELTGFAKRLLEMDNEKLSLMRKIDTLERLLSRERRTKQFH